MRTMPSVTVTMVPSLCAFGRRSSKFRSWLLIRSLIFGVGFSCMLLYSGLDRRGLAATCSCVSYVFICDSTASMTSVAGRVTAPGNRRSARVGAYAGRSRMSPAHRAAFRRSSATDLICSRPSRLRQGSMRFSFRRQGLERRRVHLVDELLGLARSSYRCSAMPAATSGVGCRASSAHEVSSPSSLELLAADIEHQVRQLSGKSSFGILAINPAICRILGDLRRQQAEHAPTTCPRTIFLLRPLEDRFGVRASDGCPASSCHRLALRSGSPTGRRRCRLCALGVDLALARMRSAPFHRQIGDRPWRAGSRAPSLRSCSISACAAASCRPPSSFALSRASSTISSRACFSAWATDLGGLSAWPHRAAFPRRALFGKFLLVLAALGCGQAFGDFAPCARSMRLHQIGGQTILHGEPDEEARNDDHLANQR